MLQWLAGSSQSKPAVLTAVEVPPWLALICPIFSGSLTEPVTVPVVLWEISPDRYSHLAGSWIGNGQFSPGLTTTNLSYTMEWCPPASTISFHLQHMHGRVCAQCCWSACLLPPSSQLNEGVWNWVGLKWGEESMKQNRLLKIIWTEPITLLTSLLWIFLNINLGLFLKFTEIEYGYLYHETSGIWFKRNLVILKDCGSGFECDFG